MSYDYDLEQLIDRIGQKKTKVNFQEVYSSYINGNYRSCMVMLWSTIVCDILYKLQDLDSLYSDSKAKSILDSFNADLESDRTKSGHWEQKLLLDVDELGMIEKKLIPHFQFIQTTRHLSAHPAVDTHYDLYVPDKYLAKSSIIQALTGLLIRPVVMTNKVLKTFLDDISENADILLNSQLETYLDARYLNKFSDETALHIIKSMWKLTLGLDNPECNKNRRINKLTLTYLLEKYEDLFTQEISDNPEFYSQHLNLSVDTIRLVIFSVFFSNPWVFPYLKPEIQMLFHNCKYDNAITFFLSRFTFQTFKEMEEALKEKIDEGVIQAVFREVIYTDIKSLCDIYGDENHSDFVRLCIYIYTSAISYDQGDFFFSVYLELVLNEMSEEDVILLLERGNDNSQVYGRGRSKYEHQQIKNYIKEKEYDIDLSLYEWFFRNH